MGGMSLPATTIMPDRLMDHLPYNDFGYHVYLISPPAVQDDFSVASCGIVPLGNPRRNALRGDTTASPPHFKIGLF